jgi:hypothetical protein
MAVVLVCLLAQVAVAPAASAADYPSWDEVQAAKSDQAAAQAEADRITAFIADLTAESAELGRITIEKAAAAAAAQSSLDAAKARADLLDTAAKKATADAADEHERYGRIIAQLVQATGGQDLTMRLMLDGTASGDLLYRLGAISKLTERANGLEERARQQRNQAKALGAQADLAEAERDRLDVLAHKALGEAQAAEEAANDRLAAQQAAGDTLYAQLALLSDRTADVQRRFTLGEQERRRAAEAAANASAGGGGGGGSIQTGDVVVDPDGARAYARGAVVGYGWGDAQYQCLVSLWNRESGWRANAYNASSGAYGIPQSLPGEKMASAGPDWRTNGATQINWGLAYIDARYGSPCGAWAHSEGWNWY